MVPPQAQLAKRRSFNASTYSTLFPLSAATEEGDSAALSAEEFAWATALILSRATTGSAPAPFTTAESGSSRSNSNSSGSPLFGSSNSSGSSSAEDGSGGLLRNHQQSSPSPTTTQPNVPSTLVPVLDCLNHSFTPSCHYVFDATTNAFTVVTTRDIEAGEALSLSYGPRSNAA